MAQIYGQIESLKQIRSRLNRKGIDRFNSIKEINVFLKDYQSERRTILRHFESELENEIRELKENIKNNHEISSKLKKEKIEELEIRLKLNGIVLDSYYKKDKNSILGRFMMRIGIFLLEKRGEYLRNNYDHIISKTTGEIKAKINNDTDKLIGIIKNREKLISEKSTNKLKQLDTTRKAVIEMNPLIAGAIGENLVANEIAKLSDDYTLINDFSLTFDPPIYNRKENDKIFSIQIDHLLISKSGVYILETKNWSKKSIQSINLRSPIKQINRTRFGLFRIWKSKGIKLEKHHWGEKKIPIRSLIVMINQKPKEEFKYVKIVLLKDLNRYIQFFDPIFSHNEYMEIAKYLIKLNNSNRSN